MGCLPGWPRLVLPRCSPPSSVVLAAEPVERHSSTSTARTARKAVEIAGSSADRRLATSSAGSARSGAAIRCYLVFLCAFLCWADPFAVAAALLSTYPSSPPSYLRASASAPPFSYSPLSVETWTCVDHGELSYSPFFGLLFSLFCPRLPVSPFFRLLFSLLYPLVPFFFPAFAISSSGCMDRS